MAVELPIESGNPDQSFNTTLVDQEFAFDFRWNERAQRWYMNVSKEDGTPLVTSVAVVLGTLLAGKVSVSIDGFPEGVFKVVDTEGTNRDATLDDLGDRVVVLFIEVSEFE